MQEPTQSLLHGLQCAAAVGTPKPAELHQLQYLQNLQQFQVLQTISSVPGMSSSIVPFQGLNAFNISVQAQSQHQHIQEQQLPQVQQQSIGDVASIFSLDASSGLGALWEDFISGNGADGGRDASAGTKASRKILKHYQACLACSRSKKRCDGARPCSTCMVRGKVDECTNQKPGTQTHTAPDTDGSTNLKAERRNCDAVEDPMVRALSLETEVKAATVGGGDRTVNREGDSAICLVEEAVDVAEAEADMASNAAAECESAQLAAEASVSLHGSQDPSKDALQTAATHAAGAAVHAARAAAAANVAVRAATRAADAANAAAAAEEKKKGKARREEKKEEEAGAGALVQVSPARLSRAQHDAQGSAFLDAQEISVDRPIPYRNNTVARKFRPPPQLSQLSSCSTPDIVPVLLRNMWENQGVCAERITTMYTLLPQRLQQVLQLALNSAHRVLLANAPQLHADVEAERVGAGSKRKRLDEGGRGGASEEDENVNTWIDSTRCGYIFNDIDPGSNRWHLCSVNDWLADLAGMHREELLARFANCDVNLACSEFRQLCAHVSALVFQLTHTPKNGEQLTHQAKKQHYIYSRWTSGFAREELGPGKLIRQCYTLVADASGRICHMKRTLVMISEEEYDRVANLAPQSCDFLASTVVGRKSAAELNSREILEEESFATMTASETGRARLNLLANILENQFAPIVKRARSLDETLTEAQPSRPSGLSGVVVGGVGPLV